MIKSVMDTVAERIKAARQKAGWTQEQLAHRAGLSKSYLCMIESGGREPHLSKLVAISQVLELPLWFFFGEEKPDPDLVLAFHQYRPLVEWAQRVGLGKDDVEKLIGIGDAFFEVKS